MRQLTWHGPGMLEWEEVPAPEIGAAGDALVGPVAVTLCDLDRPIVTGAYALPGPIALGHEFVAEVLDIGPAVAGFAPGDLVVVPFEISCGACATCRRGLTANCLSVPARSMLGVRCYR